MRTIRIEQQLFRSRVARRLFLLFAACSLVPVTVLAILTVADRTRQLREQSNERMRRVRQGRRDARHRPSGAPRHWTCRVSASVSRPGSRPCARSIPARPRSSSNDSRRWRSSITVPGSSRRPGERIRPPALSAAEIARLQRGRQSAPDRSREKTRAAVRS